MAYRCGSNAINYCTVTQDTSLSVLPAPTSVPSSAFDLHDLVEDSDTVNFAAANSLYLTVHSQNNIVASAPDLASASEITAVLTSANALVFKRAATGKYVRLGRDTDQMLIAEGASHTDGAPLSFALLQNGRVIIAATNSLGIANYVALRTTDSVITANSSSPVSPLASFDMALKLSVGPTPIPLPQSDCDEATAMLIWQLSGAFLLTVGFYLAVDSAAAAGIASRLAALIRATPAVEGTFIKLAAQATLRVSSTAGPKILLKSLYENNIRMTAWKIIFQGVGWWGMTKIVVAILIEIALDAEAAAAALVAGIAVWASQTEGALLKYLGCQASAGN